MKTHRWIAVLIILTSVSLYAEVEVEVYNGYQTSNCSEEKEFVIAGSVEELKKYHYQNDDWTLRSYKRVAPPGECKEYTGSEDVQDTFVTPAALPDNTEAPVVFIPAPFPVPILWDNFDAEKNQELLDSWLPETEKRAPIATWVGVYSGATWSTSVSVEWKVGTSADHEHAAHIDFEPNPWEISVFPERIYRKAKANGIPPEHLVIQAQMEEHIHALQGKARAEVYGKSEDEFEGFSIADSHAMEVEAKSSIQTIIWPFLYGMLPPLVLEPLENNPAFEDYWENRKEYFELLEKEVEEVTKADRNRFKELQEYFINLPPVKSRINLDYEGKEGDEEAE